MIFIFGWIFASLKDNRFLLPFSRSPVPPVLPFSRFPVFPFSRFLHRFLWQRGGIHLRHQGRLQLRPFLREAGLSLAGALKWWEIEMLRDSAVQPQDLKEHAYHVEHAYGFRGHQRMAFAFGCRKISGCYAKRGTSGRRSLSFQ